MLFKSQKVVKDDLQKKLDLDQAILDKKLCTQLNH